ncbi:MAG: amino acid adenylation domain-containing protein, partial [Bacteroidota bacterium]
MPVSSTAFPYPTLQETLLHAEGSITFIRNSQTEERLTYQELLQAARQVLHGLQAQGISAGDEAVLLLEDPKDFLLAFWACICGGIIPVPLEVSSKADQSQKVLQVWATLKAPCLITQQKQQERLFTKESGLQLGELQPKTYYLEELMSAESMAPLHPGGLQDLAYIQFSSGSTGNPKGVMLTHENLLTNTHDIIARSEITAEDVMLSWMPLTHDMGMICFHLSALVAGAHQYIMPTQVFIRNPLLWMDKAHQHRASLLYSPNFGYHYFLSMLQPGHMADWELEQVRLIYNGAEPILPKLCEEFAEALHPYGLQPQVMFPGYGMAEASVAVALPQVGDPMRVHRLHREHLEVGQAILATEETEAALEFVETGLAMDHTEIRICGSEDEPLPDRHVGHVHIRGGNVTQGYYQNPEATEALLAGGGWIRTGDLGFLDQGRFTITGRAKNIIIINGQNYYPQDIERVVSERFPDFGLGKVVACSHKADQGEELLLFLLFKPSLQKFAPKAQQVAHWLRHSLGLAPQHIIPLRQVPKTTSGKVQHFKLAQQFAEGTFDPVVEELAKLTNNQPEAAEQDLEGLVHRLFGISTVSAETELAELGLSSLDSMRLVTHIQRELGAQVTISELYAAKNWAGLKALIASASPQKLVAIEPREEQEYYPLSDGQRRFWMLQQWAPDTTRYQLKALTRYHRPLERPALEAALSHLWHRHDSLRTYFPTVQGVPVQMVAQASGLPLSWQSVDQESTAVSQMRPLLSQPLSLTEGPLIQFHVMEYPGGSLLGMCLHHAIADGWSMEVLQQEFSAAYTAALADQEVALPKLPWDYKDLTIHAAEQDTEGALDYWRKQLRAPLPNLALPFLKPNATERALQPGGATFALATGVEAFAQPHQLTPFAVLLAALTNTLGHYSQADELMLGTDTSGRHIPGVEHQVGYHLHTLPLRLSFTPQESFLGRAKSIQQTLLGAYEHQEVAYGDLLHLANTQDPGPEASALFDALVLYQTVGQEESFTMALEGHEAEAVALPRQGVMDLEFIFEPTPQGTDLRIRYNPERYQHTDCVQLGNFVQKTLAEGLLHPETKALPPAVEEGISVLEGSSARHQEAGWLSLFEQTVAAHGARAALTDGSQHYTYAELAHTCNAWAGALVSDFGIKPGEVVAILVPPSAHLTVAFLSILKAGGVALPIEYTYPSQRIHQLLADGEAKVVIAAPELASEIPSGPWQTAMLSDLDQAQPIALPLPGPDDLAYLMYTSGSTGKPKGVMISHGALTDYARTFAEYFQLTETDRFIQQSSCSFDVFIEEVFPTLAVGAQVVVAPRGGSDVTALRQLIEESQATFLSVTPGILAEMTQQPCPPSLRVVISGGESLKAWQLRDWHRQTKVYNTYGPTEATVCITYHPISQPGDLAYIGTPLASHTIKLADPNGQAVPWGIPGEIWVSGPGLAIGYWKEEKQTQQAFPEQEGVRWYRTGDMGRATRDHGIQFLGRKDAQLKVRGYRIEPTEVENALVNISGIEEAFVTATEKHRSQQLVAYLVGDASHKSIKDLRSELAAVLPPHMVPSGWLWVDHLPRLTSGKINAKALPAADSQEEEEAVLPSTHEEQKLWAMFRELLPEEVTSIHQSFFLLGGNSLLAARLLNLIQGQWDTSLTLRDLFVNHTVAELAQRVGNTATQTTIPQAEAAAHYPLNAAQTHLWVQQEFDTSGAAFHLPWQMTLRGQEELPAFQQAWQHLMVRHESLRTVYKLEAGLPVQVVLPEDTPLPFQAYSDEVPTGAALQEVIQAPFAVDAQPLFCIQAFSGPGTAVTVLLTFHHLAVDGWSMEILLTELASLLKEQSLPALPIRLRDMAVWQRSRSYSESQKYWEDKLAGELEAIELPANTPKHQVEKQDGKVLSFAVPTALIKQIETVAQQEEATLFQGLLALWYTLFIRYTGHQDQVIATTANGRNHQEIEPLVGYFIRTLPLRTHVQAKDSFTQILRAARTTAVEAMTHQDFPVEQWLREEARSTEGLFDILLIVQNFQERKEELPEAISRVKALDTDTSLNDLLIEYHQFGGTWECKIRFNAERFSEARIRRMVQHFTQLAQAITAAPTQAISEFPLVTVPEEEQILKEFNPEITPRKTASIWDQFSAQALATPQAPAVVYENQQISYQALHGQAVKIAGFLASQCLPTGSLVAILMERSPDSLAVLLACIQAGVAFVPIDPNYPEARIALLLEDSGAEAVITDEEKESPSGLASWSVSEMLSEGVTTTPKLVDTDLAYLLYTSGTTGTPKGVRISRGALQDYVTTFTEYFQITAADKVIQQSSLSFDIFVEEIFPALVTGAMVVIVPTGGQDVGTLAATFRQHQATLLSTTPLVIEALNEQYANLPSLRILISGGDVLRPHQITHFPATVRLFNTYGPTEATVCASYYPIVDRNLASLIGKPLPQHHLYCLLPDGGLAPVGIPGELCIAGAGLAEGYHGREQETYERFVPNPFVPGTKMYRTGDMAQWQEDGTLEYLGRRDQQLKVRGYRVEPQELAQAALTYPAVQHAQVLVEEVKGIPQLILFITLSGTSDGSPLKGHVQSLLPHYLHPAAIVVVLSIPQTAHGKTDTQALRKVYQQQKEHGSGARQPMTKLEEQIAKAYAFTLRVDRPNRDDHFLTLGGHSIKAVQLANLLKKEIDLPLTSADILKYPTPESLAQALTARQPQSNAVPQREEQDHYPLSAVQNQMWFLSQLEAEPAAYNIALAYQVEGSFDQALWNRAIERVLHRHQSLRSRVTVMDEEPRWMVSDDAKAFNTVVRPMPTEEGLQSALNAAAQKPFHLEKDSLFRVSVFVSDTEWVLVLSLHHIIADGWSVRVLAQELVAAYEQGSEPAPVKHQFYDFYTPPKDQPKAVQFWKDELAAPLPVLELATDHPRPAIKTAKGEVFAKALPSEIMQGSFAAQAGGTFGLVWSVLQTYLWRATGKTDFTIGSPMALRESPDLEGQIGCYLNTVVYRSQLGPEHTAEELAQRVAAQLTRVREHQAFPFDQIVYAVQPERDLSRSPLFDVMLVLHNQTEHQQWSTQLQGAKVTELTPTAIKTKVDLTFNIHLVPHGYELRLEYNRDLFTPQRMAYLAEGFVTLWQAMVQNPQAKLSTLPIHGKAEREALAQWQQGARLPEPILGALASIEQQVL